MGWTCQHDHKGQCKLLKQPCVAGMKGCTINKNAEGIIFSQPIGTTYEEAPQECIDYAALSRSH